MVWSEIVLAIATISVSIVAVFISLRLGRAQIRIDLFEKRYEALHFLGDFIAQFNIIFRVNPKYSSMRKLT